MIRVHPCLSVAALALTALLGCSNLGTTARLPSDLDARIQGEGIVRSANDLIFRYTEAPGRSRSHWEDRKASIVVTPATILIHKNAKIGLEITPRTLRAVAIERDGMRLRLRAGSAAPKSSGRSSLPMATPRDGPGISGPWSRRPNRNY